MDSKPASEPMPVRSLFISDVHLGCRFSQVEALIDLLERLHPEFIFLVGDFIDIRQLCRRWHWPPKYRQLITLIEEHIHRGVQVIYTPGNHDHFLRNHPLTASSSTSRIQLCDQFIHALADGRRMLVIHGDQFDRVEKNASWFSHLGTVAYEALLMTDRRINCFMLRYLKRRLPLSRLLKQTTKQLVQWLSSSQEKIFQYAQNQNCNVITCGHTHIPGRIQREGITYYNCGDWIENATVLIESQDGALELRHWTPVKRTDIVPPKANGERLSQSSGIEAFILQTLNRWAHA